MFFLIYYAQLFFSYQRNQLSLPFNIDSGIRVKEDFYLITFF